MHKCNLLLHCGAHRVPREDLRTVHTPRRTATWQPIPHHDLLTLVENTLPRYGMRIIEQAHAITHEGHRYFGLLQIANGHTHPDYSWVLGLRNSHDKRLPAGLVLGSQVLVCDNLNFHGEINIARKHTARILQALPGLVHEAVGRLNGNWHAQDRRIERYKETDLTPLAAHDLTIRALDNGVISGSMVPKVLKEYRNPHHPEFRSRNLWSYHNAVTETLKGNLGMLPGRTKRFNVLCEEFAARNGHV
ncbi:MAG: DUF932 domain-containing protein [Kiritimatiellae bacterium]|nr:DUF932 domain-containing protein [Kiritimatiellia bacterium]